MENSPEEKEAKIAEDRTTLLGYVVNRSVFKTIKRAWHTRHSLCR
jgi:hypothetical protein